MSHRSNFVWIENNETKIYYDGGTSGIYCPNILAQGYEYCKEYFSKCREEGLMNNAFAEGGILIDTDKKNILIFGGQDLMGYLAHQRYYIKHVKEVWKSYHIEWCSQGIIDIADYIGEKDEHIHSENCYTKFERIDGFFEDIITDDEYLDCYDFESQETVVTILHKGKLWDYKFFDGSFGLERFLSLGEDLKDNIPDYYQIIKWRKEDELCECALIDYDKKEMFVCWAADIDNRDLIKIAEIWNAWKIERQTVGLIFNFDYTNRNFSKIEMTEEDFLNVKDNYFVLPKGY